MQSLFTMFSALTLAFVAGCASSPTDSASPGRESAHAEAGHACVECAAKGAGHCATCDAGAEAHCAECAAAKTQSERNDDAPVATIQARGMSCPLCASNADRRLKRLDGVEWVNIDLGSGAVKVGLSESGERPSEKQLTDAILDAGFTPVSVAMPAKEGE